MKTSLPEFSIIIPQYGRSHLTQAAVNSLLITQTEPMEILIVDDGSPSAEVAPLHSLFHDSICLLRLPRRQGVTAAWNLGARVACGKTLVFLNNDTISTGPWLKRLAAPLQQGTALMSGPATRKEKELPLGAGPFLKGWCLGIRRETFCSIGMFDERFRLYFSDTDLQLRLQRWSSRALARCPGLPLQHLGRSSTRMLPTRRIEWRQDRARFRQKWGTGCREATCLR